MVEFGKTRCSGDCVEFDAREGDKRCVVAVCHDVLQSLDGAAADDFEPLEALNRFWDEITEAAERRFASARDGERIELDYKSIISGAPT